jgi:hypothetical protein
MDTLVVCLQIYWICFLILEGIILYEIFKLIRIINDNFNENIYQKKNNNYCKYDENEDPPIGLN